MFKDIFSNVLNIFFDPLLARLDTPIITEPDTHTGLLIGGTIIVLSLLTFHCGKNFFKLNPNVVYFYENSPRGSDYCHDCYMVDMNDPSAFILRNLVDLSSWRECFPGQFIFTSKLIKGKLYTVLWYKCLGFTPPSQDVYERTLEEYRRLPSQHLLDINNPDARLRGLDILIIPYYIWKIAHPKTVIYSNLVPAVYGSGYKLQLVIRLVNNNFWLDLPLQRHPYPRDQ